MKTILPLIAMLLTSTMPAMASVSVSSPANNSTVGSPVHYTATASTTCSKGVSAMGVYVNNQRVVLQNGASLNANVTLSNGYYQTVVQEWDGCGGSTATPVDITVSGQSGTPTAVNVSSPANNSTVSSPVTFSANATTGTCSNGINAIGVYVDNSLAYKTGGAALQTSLAISTGKHYVVVQAWDNCGGAIKTPLTITVQPAAAATVSISASPASINSGGSSVLSVTASNATQVTITGSNGTSYTLPTSGGQQTVTPTATTTYTATATGASGKVSSTATVTVGNTTAVVVSSPANNSTVSSPVTFAAQATTAVCAKGIAAIGVYVDNTLAYKINGAVLQTSLAISTGKHYVVVQAWDKCGGAIKTPLTITVQSSTQPTVTIAANPAFINAGGTSVLNVVATNATQVTIAGSDGTSYTLASTGGSQTVTPAATTTYTATVTGPNGTATAQTTVTLTSPSAGVAVLMHKNDLAGDGANLNEVTLTPANVNAKNFGRKYALPVDGQIYAQPLYVPGLMVNGAAHNTVFAATQNDSVYAFDSDSGSQLWKMSLGTTVSNNDPEGVQPILGILSTPVIDPTTNTIYVTAVTSGRVLKLHALDITTGAEKFGGPVAVTASVPGTGAGSSNGKVPLSAGCYQRTALTLANGRIYMGFGHCDHGWMLAYNASTLAQTQAFNTSPNGVGGDIWMGGAAPVVDSNGNLYLESADDIGSTAPSSTDYPDAFLKMSPDLQVLDFLIPSDERYLESNDADLGSGGPILMPNNSSSHPFELIGGGKDGRVFVIDRNGMGGYHADPNGQNDNVQTVQTGTQQFDNIWGSPAFWNGLLYFHTEGDVLRSYVWNAQGSAGLLATHSANSGNIVYLNHGASPSISANGTNDGIVWDVDNSGYPKNGGSGGSPAVLHAYNADDVGQELYNSSQAGSGRDTAGHACKFSVPTVTGGKVFVPTCTELDIYGLLP